MASKNMLLLQNLQRTFIIWYLQLHSNVIFQTTSTVKNIVKVYEKSENHGKVNFVFYITLYVFLGVEYLLCVFRCRISFYYKKWRFPGIFSRK